MSLSTNLSVASSATRARRTAIGCVALATLLHLLVLGRFDLGVDEAHYALYGLLTDWSYFDHPPMVGWLQALVLRFSEADWALRLWPMAMSIGTSLYLYLLAIRLYPDEGPWVGAVSVVLLQSALIFQLISMAMVPEGPLLLFGVAAAYHLHPALSEGRGRDWLLAGAFLGLAGLSKYTAITLVVSVLLYLALEKSWRRLLSPWPWLAVLFAIALVSPVFYWNMAHDWLSFDYQLGHGIPDRQWEWGRFLLAQAGQLLAYSPGIYLFGLVAVITVLRKQPDHAERYLLALVLPIVLLFGWSSGLEETLPHWTLLGWALLAPLSAHWLIQYRHSRWVRAGVGLSLAYSVLLVVLIHSLLWTPWLPFKEHKHPLGDLIGWREAAVQAAELYDALPPGGERRPVLFIGNWAMASRIAWYARPRPLQVIDKRYDQFDLWYGTPEQGAHGILIVPEKFHGRSEASGLARFAQCQERAIQSVELKETAVHTFRFYQCEGYGE